MRILFVPSCLLFAACGGDADPVGLDVLGAGSQDLAMVEIEVLATAADGLSTPSDLAFNPRSPFELWVTNLTDDSITRLDGDDYSNAWTSGGFGQEHFLHEPMSLAFSDFGNFATIHDTDDLTQGTCTPKDFMGPTLWDDSDRFDGAHAGHLDMLHNSPLGGGIAWESANVYWVFDGWNSSLTRYDFKDDHGYGGSYHGDAVVRRYVEGSVSRVEGTPSHLDYDPATRLLYAADTANGRIAVLDTTQGTDGGFVGPDYDGADQQRVNGGVLDGLIDGSSVEVLLTDKGEPTIPSTTLVAPAGLELADGLLWVTDSATSRILAFELDGTLVDWIEMDLPAGSLGGLDIDEEGRIVVVDMIAEEVLRISPAPLVE
jgi:sugar lactone lactonase YvrE